MDSKARILDIAMNLNRIGNWAADGFDVKRKRIETFLNQTSDYLNVLDVSTLQEPFKKTFIRFLKDYRRLEREGKERPRDELLWAEQMMTWGNILTHRAKLLDR